MNRVFVDTSAVLALLGPHDRQHARARRAFATLATGGADLVTTSYVLVETYALLVRRMGPTAARAFREDLAPLFEVVWVGEPLHESGLDLLLQRGRRALSLVDAVSFIAMRQRRLQSAFAFDAHFEEEGFSLVG